MFKSLISSPRRQQFFSLLIFYSACLWFRFFTTSVLPPYYLNHGLGLKQLVFAVMIAYFTSVILSIVLKTIHSHISWYLTFLFYALFILTIINLSSFWHFYLAHFFIGLIIIFFWIPYNIIHYQLTPRHRTGSSSAILFSIISILSLIAPLVSGFLASYSYNYIWIGSVIFILPPIYLIRFQPNILIKNDLIAGLKEIRSTRIFMFIQGVWEAMIMSIIPVFSLFFIKSPAKYGIFLAYLALVSIFANLSLGRLTDKLQKRTIFLYPLTLGLSLVTFLFPLAINHLFWWLVVTGVIQFILPLFWNTSTAIVADAHKDIEKAFTTREFVLNIARFLGISLVYINFLYQPRPTYIFYFLGSVMLFYPLILFYRTKISKKYSYL